MRSCPGLNWHWPWLEAMRAGAGYEMASVGVKYVGRFAPSPTGPLHAGSLVAALASWLDARAQRGRWLIRIEDVDTPRCLPGADRIILQQLSECGLHPDAPPLWQSRRSPVYSQALDQLITRQWAYPCHCSRKDIEVALERLGQPRLRHGELIYPGTCRVDATRRLRQHGAAPVSACAWRFRTDIYMPNVALSPVQYVRAAINAGVSSNPAATPVTRWLDRRLGAQQQAVETEVGDFILKRADGCFAYQLAVVLDDAAQGITDVVRGEDLVDNTARQVLLQQVLGLPTPCYLHTPLVLGPNGEKLSKQNGATVIDLRQPLSALNAAAGVLGLSAQNGSVTQALAAWVADWQRLAGLLAVGRSSPFPSRRSLF
jgi:glutamyl-Q tRNA(Asp) synthetase